MDRFWNGFEKRAKESEKVSPEDIVRTAVAYHVGTFNINAAKNREKVRASSSFKGGKHYIKAYDPGRKGFLGFGKKPSSSSKWEVVPGNKNNPDGPAIRFKKIS